MIFYDAFDFYEKIIPHHKNHKNHSSDINTRLINARRDESPSLHFWEMFLPDLFLQTNQKRVPIKKTATHNQVRSSFFY